MTAFEAGGTSAPATLDETLRAIVRAEIRAALADLQPVETHDDDVPLTYRQASEASGLAVSALRAAVARRDLAIVKLGGRTHRIRPEDLRRYLDRRRVSARDEAPARRLRAVGGGRR